MVKADDNSNAANGEPEHYRKLFIGGLTPNTTEEMMRDFYGKYGEIVDVIVMRDPTTKRTRGFGFVTYAAKSMVDECQKARPHVLDGKTVDPKRAVPRDANDKGAGNVSSKRLYVSGIREEHTDDMLQNYFDKYGKIEKIDIIKDKATNKNRGFAFVTFDDYDSVDQCVILKSHQISGYRCDVKKGLSKEESAKAQQGERDRMDRSNRSRGMDRGGSMGGGGGRYDQGGMGGNWGGYGGQQQDGGSWSGYGGQQGGWAGAPAPQGTWGGQPVYGGQPSGGYQAQQGWGQQPGAASWGQGQQAWNGGAQSSGGYGGYGQGGQQGQGRY